MNSVGPECNECLKKIINLLSLTVWYYFMFTIIGINFVLPILFLEVLKLKLCVIN